MRAAIIAGIAYFAAVFVAGMALGVARVLALEPLAGPVAAVLIELPIVLAFAWWTCRKLIGRLALPPSPAAALVMGTLAFMILMTAEIGLALWTPGRSGAELIAHYRQPASLIGLIGQILFASFPLLQVVRRRRPGEATS